MSADEPKAVLDFWLGDGLLLGWPSEDRNPLWFGGGAAQDALISERFGGLVTRALEGRLAAWEAEPGHRLALVILLDQFTRNVFRGQPRAFAGDRRAQQLVLQSLTLGHDAALPTVGRVFLYMPLMHAENEALQDECLARFTALQAGAPAPLRQALAGNLRAAEEHHAIVQRFGRFPHRNAVLGRDSTPEETEFLKNGPRFGQ